MLLQNVKIMLIVIKLRVVMLNVGVIRLVFMLSVVMLKYYD